WHPKTRWWAMGAGTAMHLGIEATLLTGWFSLTIISCYLAFVPASTLRKAVGRCLGWVPGRDKYQEGEPKSPTAPPKVLWRRTRRTCNAGKAVTGSFPVAG